MLLEYFSEQKIKNISFKNEENKSHHFSISPLQTTRQFMVNLYSDLTLKNITVFYDKCFYPVWAAQAREGIMPAYWTNQHLPHCFFYVSSLLWSSLWSISFLPITWMTSIFLHILLYHMICSFYFLTSFTF